MTTTYNPLAVSDYDLITPSSTAMYPLGFTFQAQDPDNPEGVKVFMYVKSHASLTAYQPYVVVPSASSGDVVYITAAPATLASGVTVAVPQVAFTSGYYGFVQIQGQCSCLLANETHVAGDFLELLNTGTTLVVDGTSGSTAFSVNSVGQLLVTLSGAGTGNVNLIGSYRTSLVSAS